MLNAAGTGGSACAHLFARPGLYLRLAWGKSPAEVLALARGFLGRGGPKPVAPEPVRFDLRSAAGPIVILTTHHCEYIARAMRGALERVGIAAEIIFERPVGGYADVPHFVICPQMFPVLPGFYVAFQMEQSVSSRWFTDDYLSRLENSFAIFDYSTRNISFLKDKGLSLKQVYYLPVGHLPGLSASLPPGADTHDYDVVFYGDANNERRQAYLNELRKHCRVRVVSEVFGEELYRILSGAKLVVNIHYYAGALLETTRVWECLSLGKLVVSERSTDMEDHGELQGLVDFVDIDDIPAMVDRVRYWLGHEPEREERVLANQAAITAGFNRFDYFFHRFLLATDNISFDEFWREAGHKYRLQIGSPVPQSAQYTDRTLDFARDNQYGFSLFPGLRHGKGWLGCAMSYKYMVMLAREHGLDRVTICEDDVEFPADFEAACTSIDAYLSAPGARWDIFRAHGRPAPGREDPRRRPARGAHLRDHQPVDQHGHEHLQRWRVRYDRQLGRDQPQRRDEHHRPVPGKQARAEGGRDRTVPGRPQGGSALDDLGVPEHPVRGSHRRQQRVAEGEDRQVPGAAGFAPGFWLSSAGASSGACTHGINAADEWKIRHD